MLLYMDDVKVMRRSKLFYDFSEQECKMILGIIPSVTKDYRKKEILMSQGDVIGNIGVIKLGRAIGRKQHQDGSVQVLRVYGEGDIVGLQAASSRQRTSPITLSAVTYCSVLMFSYERLIRLETKDIDLNTKMVESLMSAMADENIRLMYKVDALSRRTLRERILCHLSIICEKRNSDTINIGMNQEQFAQYLCSNQSALCTELNNMRRDGMIDYKGKIYKVKKLK